MPRVLGGWAFSYGHQVKRVPAVDNSYRLCIAPLFRGSSGFESLISSHCFRCNVTCACNKDETDDDDDGDDDNGSLIDRPKVDRLTVLTAGTPLRCGVVSSS